MSHLHPGYLFSNHVPPTSGFFSYTMRSTSLRKCFVWYAMLMPLAPAPMAMTRMGLMVPMGWSVTSYLV